MDVKSRIPGAAQEIFQPIYDTIALPVAAINGVFFAVPQGGVLVGAALKTRAHTNLVLAGQLEKGVNILVDSIGFAVRETVVRATTADIQALFRGSLAVLVGQKVMLECPLVAVGNAGAVAYSPAGGTTVAATTTEQWLNGIPAFNNRFILPKGYEIGIEEQTTVQAIIADFVVAAALQCTLTLFGIYTRPVG